MFGLGLWRGWGLTVKSVRAKGEQLLALLTEYGYNLVTEDGINLMQES